jgi:hypothetical protein
VGLFLIIVIVAAAIVAAALALFRTAENARRIRRRDHVAVARLFDEPHLD